MAAFTALIFAAFGAAFADLMDGCILVKAAVVSAAGGSPKRWGFTFTAAHFVCGCVGILISSGAFQESPWWGDLISIGAVAFLLVRFTAHLNSCHSSHDHSCCEHIEHIANTGSVVLWTALALSTDAIAMGAMLRGILQQFGLSAMVGACAVEASIVGTLITAFSTVGERLVKKLDRGSFIARIPVALLFISLCYLIDELIGDFVKLSAWSHAALVGVYALAAVIFLSKIGAKQSDAEFRPVTGPTSLLQR